MPSIMSENPNNHEKCYWSYNANNDWSKNCNHPEKSGGPCIEYNPAFCKYYETERKHNLKKVKDKFETIGSK